MGPERREIIEKTRQLSALIREHETSRRYRECQEKILSDKKAQELYKKLVIMGSEINRRVSSGGQYTPERTQENELLQQELQDNELVREFIVAQKAYLNLIMEVAERIKNPSP